MNNRGYLVLSIRELAERVSRFDLGIALSNFTCMRDPSIERFVRCQSMVFAEEMYGATYFFLDAYAWVRGRIVILGIFTLAIAAADFGSLSKSQHKKVFGHKTHGKSGSHRGAWLLGQFARADGVSADELPGREMYQCALATLRRLREASSGRVLILECAPYLVPVYESYDFKVLPMRDKEKPGLATMYAIPEPKRSFLYPSAV